MTKEAIHNTLSAQPFKPFALRLADGKLVQVPHPDFVLLTQGGRTAVVTTEGENFEIIDLALVTAIEIQSTSGSKGR